MKKEPQEARKALYDCAQICVGLSTLLEPFLPHATSKLRKQLGIKEVPQWEFKELRPVNLGKVTPLFKKY